MADWFTVTLAGVTAAMALFASVMFLLYAKEFFYHGIPDAWLVISGSIAFLGLTILGKVFVNGTVAETVVNVFVMLESFAMAYGFFMAYRSSEEGML